MSLLEKLENKGEEKDVSESRKKEVDRQVAKQREYEKLGMMGE